MLSSTCVRLRPACRSLDFGYRGVSSHETAALGSASSVSVRSTRSRSTSSTSDGVRSRFHCAEYLRYDVRNFTGKYRHYLKKTDDGYKIQLQRADLVNREGPFEYVLQWWV